MNFKEIFEKVKNDFKNSNRLINDINLKENLFNSNIEPRIVLESSYISNPLPITKHSKPEDLTKLYFIKLMNEIGIQTENIFGEVQLEGEIFRNIEKEKIKRYPDYGIANAGDGKSLLIEVERLNEKLDKIGFGIDQANNWFKLNLELHNEFNAVVTNFNEWYFLYYNKDINPSDMIPVKKTPEEILEIFRDIAIGKERPYIEEVKGESISKKFYDEFSYRLKLLTEKVKKRKNDVDIDIKGLDKLQEISDEEFDQMKITYYRTIFFRMMFIKILLDWKLLPFDPFKIIFDENELKINYFKSLKDLFFNIFNNEGKRTDVLEKLKELPYLNGGLFRISEIEERNPTISLNSDAIYDIWELLKKYNFTLTEEEPNGKSNGDSNAINAINPNILGYIFEKTIGDFRKETGAYYTRSKITNYITRRTLEPYLIDKINKKIPLIYPLNSIQQSKICNNENKIKIFESSIQLLKNLKVCDPAVGSGAFLISMGNLIEKYYKFFINLVGFNDLPFKTDEVIKDDKRPFKDIYDLRVYIVQNILYGIDINPSAVEICELRLWLWIIQPPKEFDAVDLKLEPLPNIEYNIREGNSLIGYTKGIRSIDAIAKKSRKIIKGVVPLSEWTGKTEESLSQMMIARNEKIKQYYNEKNAEKRHQFRFEIKKMTENYNQNFDTILLNSYQEKGIISKNITIEPNKLKDLDLNNIESMLIRAKNGKSFFISEDQKQLIKTDDDGGLINGITFKDNLISISNRVYYPKQSDSFKAQIPLDFFNKILKYIKIEQIENIKIKFLIDSSDLYELKRLHWSMEFSDFFISKGFDIIVTNPPYGNILTELGQTILKETDKIIEDIYINFLYKLARKEIPFLYAGILTPKSYLLRQKYLDIRNTLLENVGIYEITDIGSNQFHGATNEVQIIYFHKNKEYNENLVIQDLFEENKRISYNLKKKSKKSIKIDNINICMNKGCKYYNASAEFYFYSKDIKCPICNEKTLPLNRIRIKPTEKIFEILNKIEKKGNLNFLNTIDYPNMIRGEEDVGYNKIKKLIKENNQGSCYYIDAKDDFAYYRFKKNKSLNIEDIPSTVLKGNNYNYYKNPRLLIKHNNIIPEAIYTSEKACFSSSIYALISEDSNTLKLLCAILNSILIQFYCIYGINNQKDTTINLNQYMIRHLPIIKPEKKIFDKIVENVDKIIRYFERNEIIDNSCKDYFKEIDNLIFKMFKISTEEKNLISSLTSSQIVHFNNIYS